MGHILLVKLYEVGHVHRHLFYLRVVKLLDVMQRALVLRGHEVYGSAFTTEPTAPSDSATVNAQ